MSEEINTLEANTQIDPIFIDDYDIFSKDNLIDENKEFIKTLLDKSNYFFDDDDDDEQQKLIQTDLSKPQMTGDMNTEKIIPVETPIYNIDTPVTKVEPPIDDPFINTADDITEQDDNLIYAKYAPPPPDNPVELIHPREKFRQKVKQLRKRKEEYRKRAKKKGNSNTD